MPTKKPQKRKEKKADLRLLILALVQRGLGTAYDLHTHAALSVGTCLPGLAEMEKAGLVKGVSGKRKSRRYALTAAGRNALAAGIRKIARPIPDDELPADVESVLRIAYLLWLSGPPGPAQAFLRRAAQDRLQRARVATKEAAEALAKARSEAAKGHGHKWMRELAAIERLGAEARALRRIASLLPGLPR